MATIKTKKYQIKYSFENGNVILDILEVFENYRGNGIARKAMKRFMKKFKTRNIELHAYPQDNETNINKLVSLYESFGFTVVCGDNNIGFEMKN